MYQLLTMEISKLDISNTPNPRQFEPSRESILVDNQLSCHNILYLK